MHAVRPQHNTFFISLVYMHVYVCKIIDVEALVQSTCDALEVCVIICMSTYACQLCTRQT